MKDEYVLPSEVVSLEATSAKWSAEFAKRLPEEIRAIAFCAPSSFREPEIDDVWHPAIRQRGFFRFLLAQIPLYVRALGSGIVRIVCGRFGRAIFIPCPGATVLGVGPLYIVKPNQDGVVTTYCRSEDRDRMAWLIADDTVKDPRGYPVSRFFIFGAYWRLILGWMCISLKGRGNGIEWMIASVLNLRWIISFRWADLLMWGLRIRETIATMRPEKIFSVHEMHPHARVAWSESKRAGISTLAIQHASISRAKLWYFPSQKEFNAGLVTPHEFVVFSEGDRNLLAPFYPPTTQFYFGCSPRFSHWQAFNNENANKVTATEHILFAGSIPWWDNEVVLQGVEKFVCATEAVPYPALLRFHPAALISRSQKRRIGKMVDKGMLKISSGSLQDDLVNSVAVIGMNTTVLEEGMLLGLPAIALVSNHYLSFASKLAMPVSLGVFNWEKIKQCIATANENSAKYIQQSKNALGIDRLIATIIR